MTRESLSETRPNAPSVRDRCTLSVLVGPDVGRVIAIDPAGAIVGRGEEADVRVDDPGLSRNHARIFRMGDAYYLQDLASTNGSWVDGAPITDATLISDGCRIALGPSVVLSAQLQDATQQEAGLRLYQSTIRDGLTQLYNRRYLDRRLAEEVAFALRHQTVLSVLMLDIDHFKQVNDTFGHQAGDAVLKVLAATMARLVRTEDVVARYGGEEFCIIARGIDARNASIFGERLRRTVESVSAPLDDRSLSVTISLGVATLTPTSSYVDAASLLAGADQALYQAKTSGRNRVVSAR